MISLADYEIFINFVLFTGMPALSGSMLLLCLLSLFSLANGEYSVHFY